VNILYHHRTAGDRVERVHIMGIVRAFRSLGHTVLISSPPGCDPERPAHPCANTTTPPRGGLRARLKNFARRAPPVAFELAELAYNFYALADMLRLSRQAWPDLIYERTTANSIAPTLLARILRVPIVQEVNVTADIGRLRPLVLSRLTHAIERWVLRHAAAQVTVSRRFREMLIAAGLPGSNDALVSPNAVDADLFRPDVPLPEGAERFKPAESLVVGYVGAFVPYHGLELLVEVAPRLTDRFPQCRWLLVGDGVMRAPIKEMLKSRGLRDVFILPGAVPHEQVPSFLRLMDVCVLPASNPHGSPMKIFEFMAMGRAVLAPRLGPMEEVVQDGVNGRLFAPGDLNDFAAKLAELLADADLRTRLGEQARRDVLARHTWEANVRALLAHLAQRGVCLPRADMKPGPQHALAVNRTMRAPA